MIDKCILDYIARLKKQEEYHDKCVSKGLSVLPKKWTDKFFEGYYKAACEYKDGQHN
jgi:hypothetical protein